MGLGTRLEDSYVSCRISTTRNSNNSLISGPDPNQPQCVILEATHAGVGLGLGPRLAIHMTNHLLPSIYYSLSKKGCGPPSTPLLSSHLDSPAIILGRPTSRDRRSGDHPAMSSMIVPSKDLPDFSPIRGSEGQDPPNVGAGDNGNICPKSLFPATPCKIVSFSLFFLHMRIKLH